MSLSQKTYETLPDYPNEKAFADAVIGELEPYFKVSRQVRLTHWTGVALIVDAVMEPREAEAWKDERPVFAVEFKTPLDHRTSWSKSTKDFTAWAAQSVDYANAVWPGPPRQRLRVFTCPSVTAPFEDTGSLDPESPVLTQPAFYMSRLLWQLGVGELAKLKGEGWTLLGQGTHVLWSERRGVQEGRRWGLTPKAGSR